MNLQHVEQLQNLLSWVTETTGLSANMDINIWQHKHRDDQTLEYRIWIDDLFNQSTKDSGMLVALIPYIKSICQKAKIKDNDKRLKELAA